MLIRLHSAEQGVGILLFVEPDQQDLARTNGGRTQIAGWPEHRIDGFVTSATANLEGRDFLALGGNKRSYLGNERDGVIAAQFT